MIKKFLETLLVLALAYGAAWLGAAFWLRQQTDIFVANLVSQGYAIERGEARFVGFPTRVGVAFPNTSAEAPAAHGGWRWKADRIAVMLHGGAPTEPVIELDGAHRIAGFLSAPDEGFAVTVGRGVASFAFSPDFSLENIVLKLTDTSIAAPGGAEIFSFKDSSLHIALTTRHATLRVRDLAFPHDIPALGETIAALDLTLDVTGTLASGPLRQSLEAWRDGGGAVELRSFTLSWPPASAAGTATLVLDAALQPMFAATVTFRGFFDIVAALTARGYVHEREASMAKIVLGMFARPNASGEPELSLPLTVQDRRLQAGPVPLMDVPEVIWDEAARVP